MDLSFSATRVCQEFNLSYYLKCDAWPASIKEKYDMNFNYIAFKIANRAECFHFKLTKHCHTIQRLNDKPYKIVGDNICK